MAEEDAPMADAIVDRLSRHGIEAYLAERDPQPGRALSAKIIERIHRADVVAVLWTRGGAASQWVNQEVGAARAAGKPVLPLVEKGVPVKGLLEGVERIELSRTDTAVSLQSVESYLLALQDEKADAEEARREKELSDLLTVIAVGIGIAIVIAAALYLYSRR